jgi:hypothetical protein
MSNITIQGTGGGVGNQSELRETTPSLTTLSEVQRLPLDGTEALRLATSGANWKTQLVDLVGLSFQAPTSSNFNAGNGTIDVYVAATGSDSNPGTIGSPFASLQRALDYLSIYDYQHIYNGRIFVAAGTYTVTSLDLPIIINQPLGFANGNFGDGIYIVGDTVAPSNVVLNYGPGVAARGLNNGFRFEGFQINLSDTCDGFWPFDTCFIWIDAIIFNFMAASGNSNAINASRNGHLIIGTIPFQMQVSLVSGSVTFLFFAQDVASIQDDGVTWTINNVIPCLAIASVGDEANVFWGNGTVNNASNLHGSQFLNGGFIASYGYSNTPDRSAFPGTSTGTATASSANIGALIDPLYKIFAPTSGGSVTPTAVSHNNIINPAGTLATLTITIPGYAVDGEEVTFSTSKALTAITWAAATTFGGAAPTIVGAPSTMAASSSVSFIYDSAANTWYII